MHAPVSTRLSTTEKVLIKPQGPHFAENTEVCAINWFNLKLPALYKLYGLIASRYVRKVSGKLYFKGRLIKKLEGPDEPQRQNLLIVCYPNARRFLDLIDFRVFQMVSVLRIAAVRKFCFGFTENILKKPHPDGVGGQSFSKQQLYLVHHFKGADDDLRENRGRLISVAQRHRVGVFFYGLTTARLARDKSGEQQIVEFPMDGIMLFAANSEQGIERFINDADYLSMRRKNTENSLYLFSRTH